MPKLTLAGAGSNLDSDELDNKTVFLIELFIKSIELTNSHFIPSKPLEILWLLLDKTKGKYGQGKNLC